MKFSRGYGLNRFFKLMPSVIIYLPRIIGMLVSGILLGPCVLNLLDPWCFSGSASNGPCHYFDKGGSVTQNRGPKKGGQAGCVDVICPGHV